MPVDVLVQKGISKLWWNVNELYIVVLVEEKVLHFILISCNLISTLTEVKEPPLSN